jgi:hypothetical protein
MARSTLVRTVVLLVLCAVLVSPLASAAAPRPGHGPAARIAAQGVVDVFGWFQNAVVALWSKAGCRLDPFGRCVDGLTTAPTSENGCGADPFGRCVDAPATKNGCQADPFGRCVDGLTTAPSSENGCGMDPFGRCGS